VQTGSEPSYLRRPPRSRSATKDEQPPADRSTDCCSRRHKVAAITFAFRDRTDRCLLEIPQAPEGAPDECDRERTGVGVTATPRKERPALARVQLTPVPATDESGKRCRRLSNSHGNAAMAELSPSMPSPATSPRLLRVRRPAWLPDMLAATLRKRRGRPPRPPVPNRSPGTGAGVGDAARLRRSCAFAGEVHASDLCRAWRSSAFRGERALSRAASV
jgi:hypothetical protein